MNLILSTCDRIQRTSKNLVSPIKTSQKMSCASARTSQPLRPLHKARFKRRAGRFPFMVISGMVYGIGFTKQCSKALLIPFWWIYLCIYIYTWSDDTIQNKGRTESWTLLTFRLLQTSCGKSNHSPTVYFLGWWTTILEIGWTHQRAWLCCLQRVDAIFSVHSVGVLTFQVALAAFLSRPCKKHFVLLPHDAGTV